MNCTHCGGLMDKTDTTCPHCGEAVVQGKTAEEKQSAFGYVWAFLALIILVSFVGGAYVFLPVYFNGESDINTVLYQKEDGVYAVSDLVSTGVYISDAEATDVLLSSNGRVAAYIQMEDETPVLYITYTETGETVKIAENAYLPTFSHKSDSIYFIKDGALYSSNFSTTTILYSNNVSYYTVSSSQGAILASCDAEEVDGIYGIEVYDLYRLEYDGSTVTAELVAEDVVSYDNTITAKSFTKFTYITYDAETESYDGYLYEGYSTLIASDIIDFQYTSDGIIYTTVSKSTYSYSDFVYDDCEMDDSGFVLSDESSYLTEDVYLEAVEYNEEKEIRNELRLALSETIEIELYDVYIKDGDEVTLVVSGCIDIADLDSSGNFVAQMPYEFINLSDLDIETFAETIESSYSDNGVKYDFYLGAEFTDDIEISSANFSVYYSSDKKSVFVLSSSIGATSSTLYSTVVKSGEFTTLTVVDTGVTEVTYVDDSTCFYTKASGVIYKYDGSDTGIVAYLADLDRSVVDSTSIILDEVNSDTGTGTLISLDGFKRSLIYSNVDSVNLIDTDSFYFLVLASDGTYNLLGYEKGEILLIDNKVISFN